jgi:membrane protease YdiL (CAAX protease family)
MQQSTNPSSTDKFDAFIVFDPTTERAINWVYSFSFWFLLLMLGLLCYEVKAPHLKTYPATTWQNALILHTPLITDFIWLLAILVFATGFKTLRINKALKWYGDAPITLTLRGRTIQPSKLTLAACYFFVGFTLYVLQRHLVATIGGPITRQQETTEVAPLIAPAFAISAVFCAPLVEELLYRGVLFVQAYGPMRNIAAVFISTSLFTWVHVDQYSSRLGEIHYGAITSVLALGLVCSVVRAATGRVWPAFIVHTSYNFFVALTYFYSIW